RGTSKRASGCIVRRDSPPKAHVRAVPVGATINALPSSRTPARTARSKSGKRGADSSGLMGRSMVGYGGEGHGPASAPSCNPLPHGPRPMVVKVTSSPSNNIWIDRKSTRLNSSHVKSSYAVVRLKKKKTPKDGTHH